MLAFVAVLTTTLIGAWAGTTAAWETARSLRTRSGTALPAPVRAYGPGAFARDPSVEIPPPL